MKKLTKKQKKHIVSALNTFITAFGIAVAPSISTLDWSAVDQAFIIGLLAAGVRAGVKALIVHFFPQK